MVSCCTMVRFFLLSSKPSHSNILFFEHHSRKLDETHLLQDWLLGRLLGRSYRHCICSGGTCLAKFHSGHGCRTSVYCRCLDFRAQTFLWNRLARVSSSSFHRCYHLRCDHSHGFRLFDVNARMTSKDMETSLQCISTPGVRMTN